MRLDEFINRVSGTVDDQLARANPAYLPPYVVGCLLSDIGVLLRELALSYDDKSPDSSYADYREKLTFLSSLLKELGENFFPMAHTDQRLEMLRIITVDEIEELRQVGDHLGQLSEHLEKIHGCCSEIMLNINKFVRVSEVAMAEEAELLGQFLEREVTLAGEMSTVLNSARQQLYEIYERRIVR